MDFAFAFVLANGGLDTEEDYKYIAQEEKCSLRRCSTLVHSAGSAWLGSAERLLTPLLAAAFWGAGCIV